jgi:hypothetical protein
MVGKHPEQMDIVGETVGGAGAGEKPDQQVLSDGRGTVGVEFRFVSGAGFGGGVSR